MKFRSTLQSRCRYLFINPMDKKIITDSILDGIGVLGWSKANPQFVDFEGHQVLAVDRAMLLDIKASLSLANPPIKVLAVSGTLKGLSKHMSK